MAEPNLPLDSPLRRFSNRGLPDTMASATKYGHVSGHPRTPAQQKAFDQGKAHILRTMNGEQIEATYWDTVQKITRIYEEDQKKDEEVRHEIKKLQDQGDLERKLYQKHKADKERKRAGVDKEVKEETDA